VPKSDGDRGTAAQVNAEYRLTPQHSFYGAFTQSTDRSEYDPLFSPNAQDGWTLGQRWRLSDQVNVFNESQFLKSGQESGLAHTFGMDFYPAVGWNAGFTLSNGKLDASSGQVDRKAVSLSGGRTSPGTEWQSKLEWRRDTGAERRTQWVSTNRLSHRLNDSWRIAARFNYADTDDAINPVAARASSKATSASPTGRGTTTAGRVRPLQLPVRPVDDGPGQRCGLRPAHPGAVAGRRVPHRPALEVAAKAARPRRRGALWARHRAVVRLGHQLRSGQLRYDLYYQWHGLLEYRLLDVRDGGPAGLAGRCRSRYRAQLPRRRGLQLHRLQR
jgi:hypothetical protein